MFHCTTIYSLDSLRSNNFQSDWFDRIEIIIHDTLQYIYNKIDECIVAVENPRTISFYARNNKHSTLFVLPTGRFDNASVSLRSFIAIIFSLAPLNWKSSYHLCNTEEVLCLLHVGFVLFFCDGRRCGCWTSRRVGHNRRNSIAFFYLLRDFEWFETLASNLVSLYVDLPLW